MIEVTNLECSYGKIVALRGVSLSVGAGEIVTIVGPNGAGKSTLLRTMMRVKHSSSGKVVFGGEDISRLTTNQIVSRGLTMIPESRGLFGDMTVLDNLMLGGFVHRHEKDANAKRRDLLDNVLDLFPALREKLPNKSASLSGGQQQMVAIGRALMTRPKTLLLDEPSLGIAPIVIRSIFASIERMRASGLGILLVEQNVRSALKLAKRAYVLEHGKISRSGNATDLAADEAIVAAYFGKPRASPAVASVG